MYPVTCKTPKPLVRVGGVRMIDTIIRGLEENGISEIHIVVGYLKEQFEALTEEYPGVSLIENPYYAECNNISSLYAAREYLEQDRRRGRMAALQCLTLGQGRRKTASETPGGRV